MKILRLLPGVAFAGVFLWLALREISLADIKGAFLHANTLLMLAALAAFCAGYACRIERWKLMLKLDNASLRWSACAGPMLAGVAANNVLPFRTGDMLRALAFNRQLQVNAATSIATLLVERLLDLLMIIAAFGLALGCFELEHSRFFDIGGAILAAGAAAILFCLLFPSLFKPLAMRIGRIAVLVSASFGQKALSEIGKLFSTLEQLAGAHTMGKLILWSLAAWFLEGLVFWFAALSLPAIVFPTASWLALPVGTLATIIPSTPGYVGTFDFFSASAMTTLGNPTAAATAYALLVHVLLWLPPTLAGGIYLLLHPASKTDRSTKASA